MGKRTEHAPGTFSWVDLTTPDTDASKAFYGGLFDWEFDDTPLPEEAGGGVYVMCEVEGDDVAAISPQQEGDPSPPHWNNYVTVASAEDTAAKVVELGGSVIAEPFDVMTVGRMAVISDPTGGVFCVWEPRENIGAQRVNDLGCLTWNELHTGDVDAALEFYRGLFGWNSDEMDTQGGPRYVIVQVGERSNGGIMEAQGGEPTYWLPYFVVESRDGSADKTGELGGNEITRLEMPMGKIAALTDPQGAAFAIWEGQTDD